MLEQVLHPKHKLKYFEKQGWDRDWIETTKNIVREEFMSSYANYVSIKPSDTAHAPNKKVREQVSLATSHSHECVMTLLTSPGIKPLCY
jgi:hypothetical protein